MPQLAWTANLLAQGKLESSFQNGNLREFAISPNLIYNFFYLCVVQTILLLTPSKRVFHVTSLDNSVLHLLKLIIVSYCDVRIEQKTVIVSRI